ncbi:MAG TPA: type II toxin-antitoxin system PemK/MazF family toxin [Casimicrobiaceae bacterium]|nr:type II toxin-antitoxin system PemK/MazF family toxin [Casimicrobiaceae bacterium]
MTSNLRWADAPGNVALPARLTRLPKDSVANVSQVVSLDKSLLTERVGKLPRALGKRLVLSLPPAVTLATPAASARSNKPPGTRARTSHAKKTPHPLPRKRVPVAA